jgi:hypothetical protein
VFNTAVSKKHKDPLWNAAGIIRHQLRRHKGKTSPEEEEFFKVKIGEGTHSSSILDKKRRERSPDPSGVGSIDIITQSSLPPKPLLNDLSVCKENQECLSDKQSWFCEPRCFFGVKQSPALYGTASSHECPLKSVLIAELSCHFNQDTTDSFFAPTTQGVLNAKKSNTNKKKNVNCVC